MNHAFTDDRPKLDKIYVNTIRALAMDAIEAAKSGHPGAPMGLAPAGYVLWSRILKHNPRNPAWHDRDRFVLSGGHASMLLYALLHMTGYDLSLEEIRRFRQWGSKTPGHPEYGHTPGVETTTGPLGQGFATAVGMAMAERHLAARFNRPGHEIVGHYTYVVCGDGDMMEGITSEAASLAGHLGLSRLICIYDSNNICIEGCTDMTFTEDAALRFSAYGWHVQTVSDGNDLDAIETALNAAKAETEKPSIILLCTQIAYGSPNKQGCASAHGAPLGVEEVRLAKRNLECPEDALFCVPESVDVLREACVGRGEAAEKEWLKAFEAYEAAFPELAEALETAVSGALPAGWDGGFPDFAAGGAIATRAASGKVLNAIAARVPQLMGGSADLAPSNNTLIGGAPDFQKNAYHGRNIRFGVREHAMGAILSGLALHKGIIPYGGTFLVFADYLRPAIRLAAMMKLPVIYVFTHDSIAVGEDGPTHQPVEQLASLRSIPGLTVLRPADAAETAEAWRHAVGNASGPTALILSRQNLPILDRNRFAPASGLEKGAYILQEPSGKPDVLIIGSGAEVHPALAAAARLLERGISARVVSMPSWELFEKAPAAYRNEVLPPEIEKRVVVEAGISMGWERYAGNGGVLVCIDRFGASAPGDTLMKNFGFSADNIVERTIALLGR